MPPSERKSVALIIDKTKRLKLLHNLVTGFKVRCNALHIIIIFKRIDKAHQFSPCPLGSISVEMVGFQTNLVEEDSPSFSLKRI